MSLFPIGTKNGIQRGIYIFSFVHDAAPQDAFLCEAAFLHHPSAGRIAYIMLCLQTIQGKGGKNRINHSPECLGGIPAIPVFPGKTVAQFRSVIIGGIPYEADGTNDSICFPENNNPGRRTACTKTGAEIPDKGRRFGNAAMRFPQNITGYFGIRSITKDIFCILHTRLAETQVLCLQGRKTKKEGRRRHRTVWIFRRGEETAP